MTVFLPLALSLGSAQAQIYICKDASGRTITSDRPIPECADRAMRELDKSGRARREIPPPMSAEEKQQLQLQEEQRKAEEAAAEEQRRNDRLLRARYRSEGDIETARKRSIDVVDEHIKHERTVLAAAEKQQQKSQAEADSHKKKNVSIAAALQYQLNEDELTIANAKKKIEEYEAEIAQINAKFDQMLKRYRELPGMTAEK